MYKNVFLSGYYYRSKISEIEIASGIDQETDQELESLKSKYSQLVLDKLILPKKKSLNSKSAYYFQVWGDFTQKEMKRHEDFTMVEISDFKNLDKQFKTLLKKEDYV